MDYSNLFDQHVAATAAQRQLQARQQQQQAQTSAPQQQGGGGLVGFLQGLGRSAGSSYNYLGTGIANVLSEMTGQEQQQRDMNQQKNQQDVATIKALGQKLRQASDPAQQQRLRDAISKITNISGQGDQALNQRQDQIIQQNDPIKGAAAVGSIGLDVLGAGAGSQLLKGGVRQAVIGGAKQGALFGGAQGALQPVMDKGGQVTSEDIFGNAASGAGMGALSGAGGGALGKLGASTLLKDGAINSAITGQPRAIAGGLADNAATSAPGALSNVRSAIANKGAQMEARAGGFGIGEKAPGSSPLGFYDSANIRQNLANEGIKAGSPEARLKQVEDALNNRGQAIDTLTTLSNNPLSQTERQNIAQDFLKSVESQPGVTDGVRKWAQNYADNFVKQAADNKGMINFRRGLDSQVINFNQNPQGALVDKQLAARAFRDVLSQATNDRVPGVSTVNNSYHNLMNAKEYLVGGAKAISDQSQGQGGGGLFTRALTNDTAQGVKSRLGQQLQKVAPKDGVPPGGGGGGRGGEAGSIAVPNLPDGIGRELMGAAITPTVARGAAGMQPDQAPADTSNFADAASPDMSQLGGTPDQSGGVDPLAGFGVSQGDIQKAMVDAVQSGNSKALANLTSLYNAMQSTQKASATKGLTGTQLQQANNSVSGLKDLQFLTQALQKDPNIVYKDAVPTSIAHGLLGTTDYDAARQNVADVIGRLRSGGAITGTEEQRYLSLLPSPGDPQQAAINKLQRLGSLFQSFASPQTPSSDPNLSDLLSQYAQ